MSAGKLFSDFKVSHCPACDKPVVMKHNNSDCYVCHQVLDAETDDEVGQSRLNFELHRLESELEEARELIQQSKKDIDKLYSAVQEIGVSEKAIELQMRPVQKSAVSILPPEITLLDTKIGQLEARKEQVERIQETLGYEKELDEKVVGLEMQLEDLKEKVRTARKMIDFDRVSEMLASGMNEYFNLLKKHNPDAWVQSDAKVKITANNVFFNVGEQSWERLSSSQKQFYLLAYNFALVNLMRYPDTNYPGILILDLPAKFDIKDNDESEVNNTEGTITDVESIAIQPFIDLSQKFAQSSISPQIIVAGNYLSGLIGETNRLEFKHVWQVG